jgi:hypothetical protein
MLYCFTLYPVSGLNQAERCDEDMVAIVTGFITNALLSTTAGQDSTTCSVNVARLAFDYQCSVVRHFAHVTHDNDYHV